MRWYFRLALVYVVAFAVVYLSNNYIPSQLANNFGFLLVELLFLLVFGLGAWKAGFLRTIQTRSRLAVVELAVVLAVVAYLVSAFGTVCFQNSVLGR